ncbi:MAG: GGDEF domain-containing protein [Acidobacteriota bacterium]
MTSKAPSQDARGPAAERIPARLLERLGSEPTTGRSPLRNSLNAFEEFIPLILAVHGILLLSYFGASSTQWVALIAAALSGVIGTAVRLPRSISRRARAVLLLAVAGYLLVTTGGTSSHFVLWLFILVSTYPFLISLRESVGYVVATCLLYVGTLPFSEPQEPMVVVVSRVALLLFLGFLMRQASRNLRAYSRMQQLAATDDLTGIANRRHFFDRAEREFARARRFKTPLSAVLLDLDAFKAINDTHGHAAGDLALRETARLLRRHARSVDTVARLGGDEFGMLLPQTEAEGAKVLIQRLRERISEHVIATEDAEFRVQFSAGVAELDAHCESFGELLTRADASMYGDKRSEVAYLRRV